MIYKIFATVPSYVPNTSQVETLGCIDVLDNIEDAYDLALRRHPSVIVIGDFDQTDFVVLPLIR